MTRPALLALLLLLHAPVHSATPEGFIPAELFDPGFLAGDCNYHSITPAGNGMLYFTIGSHHTGYAARFYVFDPETEAIRELARLNDVVGEDPAEVIPHGKVHTPLIEDDGYLYFTTHTSGYDGSLPDVVPDDGRRPYPGGHFMRFHLESGAFESLAQIGLENEGLITLGMDRVNDRLLALTWPSGLMFTYDIHAGHLQQWGAAQGRGEWGQLGENWGFICRTLAVTPDGRFFGSADDGRIWEFDFSRRRPHDFLEGYDLEQVPPVGESGFGLEPVPHFYWRNWRTILWNPNTASFWGIHGGSTQLFEFDPAAGVLRSVHNLRASGLEPTRRNPLRTQLGFTLGPDNTLFYLAHGPALERPERRGGIKANVYLITYDIDTGTYTDHGPVIGPGDRRVFFTESLAIGRDGHLYSVAWVETIDPARMQAVQDARGEAMPAETKNAIYEIQLIRLPPARSFLH